MDQTSPHLSLSLSLSPTLVSLCVALGVAVSVSLLASEICTEYFDLTTDLPNSPVCVCVFSYCLCEFVPGECFCAPSS